MTRSIARSFISGLILAAVCGAAALFLFYVFALPTSDVRTHIYILIGASGWGFAIPAFALFLIIGSCASWLAGWHNRWGAIGAFVGSIVPLALIYSGVMGRTVWMHEEDMTTPGILVRTVAAISLVVFAWWALRASPVHEAAA